MGLPHMEAGTMHGLDALDARVLLALADRPRATTLALAETTNASRNTVQARLNRLESNHVLRSFEHRDIPLPPSS
jgi:DNA-binding Lrp family transcriptional regulator